MRASRRSAFFAAVLSAAALCHAEMPVVAASTYEPLPGVLGPLQGTYAETQVLIPATFSPGSSAQYRFAGQEAWISFDRPLYLSAFPGEERRYTIEFRSSSGTSHAILSYIIDMCAPEPPVFLTAAGDVEATLSVALEGSGTIMASIDGAPFEPYSASEPRVFSARDDAATVIGAIAYAIDDAGNSSRYAAARWRLYPAGFVPSFSETPLPSGKRLVLAESGSGLSAELVDLTGSARLTVKSPEGTIPCAAVNASDPIGSTSSYVDLSGTQIASCVIPFPWGYENELVVHYGYVRDGVRYIEREALRLVPNFPEDEDASAPTKPVAPSIRLEESTAYVDWPANPWTILFSVADDGFVPYRQPLIIPLGAVPKTLKYYALDRSGARSATASVELPASFSPPVPRLDGVEQEGVYGSAVTVHPAGTARMRYEMTEGDDPPPPVQERSQLVPESGLRFDGRAGEVVRYRLRIVAESPVRPAGMLAAAPQERFYSFSVDRQPPPVPETSQGIRSFSSSDSLVSFKTQPGTIFVSISEDGNGPFVRYDGPTPVNGSDAGRKRYVIKAYATDEFGNRSADMVPLHVLIDRSSLYADSRGRPGATGSPDDPIPYLDDAVDTAQATGKRFIYVRGSIQLRRPVVVTGKLTIAGGFDDDWNETAVKATVSVSVPPSSSSYAFVVDDGTFALSSLRVTMTGEGAGGLVLARSGVLAVDRANLEVKGGVEMAAIRSTGTSVTVQSSTIRLTGCVTGRGIDASGAPLSLSDSTIACDSSVRLFDAIRIGEAEATVAGLRLEASPSQALSALSATRATVHVERTVLSIGGGASSCRLFSASASNLTVSSVYIDATWKGSVEAFSASNASTLRIAHLTAVVGAPKSTFASLTGSTMELVNTIAAFSGASSVLVRSDGTQASGSLVANCFWGFSSFMEGRVALSTLAEINRYASPGKPNITEDPSRMFTASGKGLLRLSTSSACVDGGVPVEWDARLDLFGSPRKASFGDVPDIGAEEL